MSSPPSRRRRRGSRRLAQPAVEVRPQTAARSVGLRWLRRVLIMSSAGVLAVLAGTGTLLYSYAGELPSLDHLSAKTLPQTTRIYARDGVTLLEERYQQRRTVIPLNQMSWDVRHATIAIEDRYGVHRPALLRAWAAGDVHSAVAASAAPAASTTAAARNR